MRRLARNRGGILAAALVGVCAFALPLTAAHAAPPATSDVHPLLCSDAWHPDIVVADAARVHNHSTAMNCDGTATRVRGWIQDTARDDRHAVVEANAFSGSRKIWTKKAVADGYGASVPFDFIGARATRLELCAWAENFWG